MNPLSFRVVAWFALISSASASNTWYVDINGTAPGTGTIADPYTSIQYAVTRPSTLFSDTILVAPGTYVEHLVITKDVRVRSIAGPEFTRIEPSQAGSTVYISAYAPPTLDGFTVAMPYAQLPGGPVAAAIFLEDGDISHCVVSNSAGTGGFGVVVSGQSTLADCTVTNTGVGVWPSQFNGSVWLHNSIVTGNQTDVLLGGYAVANISYSAGISNIDAHLFGPGNLSGDVGFWNAAHGDFRLRPGSQCIDSGDPTSPLDPDGTRHDIGALRYDSNYAPAPTRYCAGKLNGQGCVPAIGAIGSASATSGAPFAITAVNEVDHKAGLMLLGFGPIAQPFQGGLLCIQSPIKRVGAQVSGGTGPCTGSYAFDMAGYMASGAYPALVPGVLADCQWWSRDPLDPTGFGSGLSDALSFGIAP